MRPLKIVMIIQLFLACSLCELCLNDCDPSSEHLIIKVINTTDPLSILKKTLEIEGGLTMIVSCSGTNENSSCQQHCMLSPSSCSGDEDYCSLYSCSEQSPCWCSVTNLTRTHKSFDIKNRESDIIDKTVFYKQKPFVFKYKPSVLGFNVTKTLKRSLQSFFGNCPVDISVKLNVITINTQTPDLAVFVSHLDFSFINSLKQGKNMFYLPVSSLFTFDKISVKILNTDQLICDLNLSPDSFSLCFKPACVVCTEFFDSHCISQQSKDLVIALIVIIIILSISIVLILVWIVKNRIKVVGLIYKIRDFILLKLGKKTFEEIDLEELSLTSSEETLFTVPKPTASFIKVLGIIMLICTCSAQSCSDEFIITGGEIVQCVHQASLVQCTAQISSIITLSSLHSTSCLTIRDPVSQINIATISITYESGYWVCPTSTRYFTSDWSTVLSSSKRCPIESYCTTESNCDNFNTDNYNAYGLLSGLSTLLPGVSTCLNTCGGWGCGCALFDNSCTYSRWSINPTGSIFSVNQINECIFNAGIKVSITDADNETQTLYVPTNSPVSWGDLSFSFTGILPISSPNILSYDIMTDGQTAYKVPISSTGSMNSGSIGDIQGPTSTSLQRPTRTSFDFAHNLCTSTTTNTAFKVDCAKSAVSTIKTSAPRMPIISSFGVTTLNGQDQYVLLSNPPTVVLELTSPPLSFVRTINIVCPVAGLLSEVQGNPLLSAPGPSEEFVVTGCYNCAQGFEVALVASSTCAEGIVDILYENDLETNVRVNIKTLFLRTEWDIVIVSMSSDNKLVKGTIVLKSKTQEARVEVAATLMDPLIIINTNGSNVNAINSVVNQTLTSLQDPFLKWWDSIFPDAPFLKYIIITGGTVVVLIVAIILVKSFC